MNFKFTNMIESSKVSSVLDRQMSSFVNHGYFTPVLSDTKDFVVDVTKHAKPVAKVHGKELLKPVVTEYGKEGAKVVAKKQANAYATNWVDKNLVDRYVSSDSLHGYARPVLEQLVNKGVKSKVGGVATNSTDYMLNKMPQLVGTTN
ncbi:hypothetical protein [Limosilactobacillus equigenerosi]|nr:hypothetical protein [Limosilactobacillus equigenerosi]